MLFGMKKPERGGLSGEHIQLCAEGARLRPNLSGKWTEDAYISLFAPFVQSFFEDCFFVAIIMKEGNYL